MRIHDAEEAEVVALLDTIPRLTWATVQIDLAESDTDLTRFPSAAALSMMVVAAVTWRSTRVFPPEVLRYE